MTRLRRLSLGTIKAGELALTNARHAGDFGCGMSRWEACLRLYYSDEGLTKASRWEAYSRMWCLRQTTTMEMTSYGRKSHWRMKWSHTTILNLKF
jgi:hypothetical protein